MKNPLPFHLNVVVVQNVRLGQVLGKLLVCLLSCFVDIELWLSYNGIWWLCHSNVLSLIICHHFISHISFRKKKIYPTRRRKSLKNILNPSFFKIKPKVTFIQKMFGVWSTFERRTQFPAYLSLTRIWKETTQRVWVLLVTMLCCASEGGH